MNEDDNWFAGVEFVIGSLDEMPTVTCSCSGKCTERLRSESPFKVERLPIARLSPLPKVELPDFIAFIGPEFARN